MLAAILFPVFGRARENARRSSCQSNLKQIGLGIMQYTQDYDERYPWGLPSPLNANQRRGIGWAGATYPYIKSTQVFVCPSAVTVPPTAAGAVPISYAINNFIADKSLAAIEDTTRYIMLSETNNQLTVFITKTDEAGDYKSPSDFGSDLVTNDAGSGEPCCNEPPSKYLISAAGKFRDVTGSSNASEYNKPRHLEGANFLLADGHVKWYRSTNVTMDAANASQGAISFYRTYP